MSGRSTFMSPALNARAGGIESSARPDLSVVVPVFNSAPTLPELLDRLYRTLDTLDLGFEVILVDDGSGDASWRTIATEAASREGLRAFRLDRNYGQGEATVTGLSCARGRRVVTLDDDLQHPPEEIPHLLARLDGADGPEVVFGVPRRKRHHPVRRLLSATVNLFASAVIGKPVAVRFTAFRAMTSGLSARLVAVGWPGAAVSPLVFQATRRVAAVRVRHEPTSLDGSRYTFRKHLRNFIGFLSGVPEPRLRRQAGTLFWLALALALALSVLLALQLPSDTGGRVPQLALGAVALGSLLLSLFLRREAARVRAAGATGRARVGIKDSTDRPAPPVARARGAAGAPGRV